ncbi:MAG: hypothetical protein HC925_07595 [Coleofasciculaceae cyanobacterium SM2_3_26]|nr:hypothetical protein [Coleofasciculaceae cyanobacterium SM2_3_26]
MEHRDLLEPLNNLSDTENMPPALAIAIPFKGAFTPDLLRSDHAPFWLQGIGAVVLTDTANFRNPPLPQAYRHIEDPRSRLFYRFGAAGDKHRCDVGE